MKMPQPLLPFFPESCFDLVKSAFGFFKRQTGELDFAKYFECKYYDAQIFAN